MENRLVLAKVLAIKHNDLHVISVGEEVITLHLEEFLSTEFGRPVTVLKVTVLNPQSAVCDLVHFAYSMVL